MKRLLNGLILLVFACQVQAQEGSGYEGWNRAVLEKANTALHADYMSAEEKEIILLTNLARTNGELFTKTILSEWLKNKKQSRYTRSLIRELRRTSDLPLLQPGEDLYHIAEGHAVRSGRRGTSGHQGFEKRFKPVLGKYRMVAENCAYGYNKAQDIVIGLLIDEGIPDLGHRKNCLNPELNTVGVAIRPHKKFTYNCVMDFGKK